MPPSAPQISAIIVRDDIRVADVATVVFSPEDATSFSRLDVRRVVGLGVVRQAGPFLNGDGQPCGSLIVLEVADMAAAQTWADNDPYAKAGLFRDVQISAWKQVIGA